MEVEIRLLRVRPEPFTPEAIRHHVDRLADLDDEGRLIAAGPRADGSGGLIIGRFDDLDAAQRFAESDPFVTGGWETVEVHPWQPANRANHYLDDALASRRPAPERRFVTMPVDKRQWPRSPLPGQIVLVTTVDAEGEVDVAPKSWLSMVALIRRCWASGAMSVTARTTTSSRRRSSSSTSCLAHSHRRRGRW